MNSESAGNMSEGAHSNSGKICYLNELRTKNHEFCLIHSSKADQMKVKTSTISTT